MMNLLRDSSITVELNRTGLEITLAMKGRVNDRKKTRLDGVQLKMFDNPIALTEKIPCDSILTDHSELSALCSKTIPVKALNGCSENELFLRPLVHSLKEDLNWINYHMQPFFAPEETRFHIEATANYMDITWQTPRCLITSYRISSWALVISNETNIYPAEFASTCIKEKNLDRSIDTQENLHKLRISDGIIDCKALKYTSLINLSPCLRYSARIYPILEFSEHNSAGAFTQITEFVFLPGTRKSILRNRVMSP